jgi:hypothetical protein
MYWARSNVYRHCCQQPLGFEWKVNVLGKVKCVQTLLSAAAWI